ncbi:poly(U)-specific endoribonuclease-A, partial [Clonorchis sinensis]
MSTRISIPRGIPPPLSDELSMLFSDHFEHFVRNDPVYLGLNCVTWKLPFPVERLSLLPLELTPELVFRSPLDKVLCRIITCWDASERTTLVDEFLTKLFSTSLFGQVYEILFARNATQLTRPRFELAFKQVWFGQYSWDNMSNRRLQTCGFQHVYVGGKEENRVKGLHNWMRYYHLEKCARLVLETVHRKHPGLHLASMRFRWDDALKPYGTIFFGIPIHFEILIFFCAFLVGSGRDVNFLIDGKQ